MVQTSLKWKLAVIDRVVSDSPAQWDHSQFRELEQEFGGKHEAMRWVAETYGVKQSPFWSVNKQRPGAWFGVKRVWAANKSVHLMAFHMYPAGGE